ncbi:phytanoyl-CoA dioxygenase family protein [Candidatus Pelagibacter sp.]|nr:phytanoyl-CoA dioxygenase family protein [Candidatus Pelagibacter sp.]
MLFKKDSKFDFSKIYETFSSEGCVVIESYFSEDEIENFKLEYKKEIENLKKNTEIYTNKKVSRCVLKMNEKLIDIGLDENLIALMKNISSSNNVYCRSYPRLNFHRNFENQISSIEKSKISRSEFADDWHVDHANLINMHVILEDLNEGDLCMEYIPGSNNYFNMSSLYSDEEVEKMNPIKRCIGRKGTVYIHSGNTLHRLKTKKNSSRLNFKWEFTAKTNILLDVHDIANSLNDEFLIDELPSDKRNILQGIYPKKYLKGYTISKDDLIKTRSKSI